MGYKVTVGKAPCKSCPYRRDVPSGVWASNEYDKLPAYDGEIGEQISAKAGGLFMCHQHDGKLCAGWLGCHGPENLLAIRLSGLYGSEVDPSVMTYRSPVPLFRSGAAACAHGKKAIKRPAKRAQRTIERLLKNRAAADGEIA